MFPANFVTKMDKKLENNNEEFEVENLENGHATSKKQAITESSISLEKINNKTADVIGKDKYMSTRKAPLHKLGVQKDNIVPLQYAYWGTNMVSSVYFDAHSSFPYAYNATIQ